MKLFIFIPLLLSSLVFAGTSTDYCKVDAQVSQQCIIKLDKAIPTQFAIGKATIKKKKKKLEKKYDEGRLHQTLMEKVIPAVIGPNQGFYILDGHHSSTALGKADIPERKKILHLKIKRNCSRCSADEFEAYMIQDGNSYLYDNTFTLRRFYELPQSFDHLQDNPYRSLAYYVRKEECFKKVQVNFLEFIWGKVLKDELDEVGISLYGMKKSEIKEQVDLACKIVKKEIYSDLPGFNG